MQGNEDELNLQIKPANTSSDATRLGQKQTRKSLNNQKLRAQKKKQVSKRATLLQPYETATWPELSKTEQSEILDNLKRHMINLRLDQHCELIGKTKQEKIDERKLFEQNNPDIIALRSQIVSGINEVMRHLERDNLRAVIVCRSSPIQLTKMLIPLLATRGCPAVCIHDIQAVIGDLLKRKCLTSFGIKKRGDDDNAGFDPVVEYIRGVSKPIKFMGISVNDEEEGVEEEMYEARDDPEKFESTSCISVDIENIDDLKCKYYIMRKNWKTDFSENVDFIKLESDSDSDGEILNQKSETVNTENKPVELTGVLGLTPASKSLKSSQQKRKLESEDTPKLFKKDISVENSSDYNVAKIKKMVPNPDKKRIVKKKGKK